MHRPVIRPIKREMIPDFVYPSFMRENLLAMKKKKRKSSEVNLLQVNDRPIKKVCSYKRVNGRTGNPLQGNAARDFF